MTLNISLQPEYVASVAGLPVSNSLLTSLLVTAVLAAVILTGVFRKKPKSFIVRATRYLLFGLLKLSEIILGSRKRAEAVIPIVATFFVFITAANLLALVPGFLGSFYVATPSGQVPLLRSPNSDLNTTLALALVAVAATQYFSLRKLGASLYQLVICCAASFIADAASR